MSGCMNTRNKIPGQLAVTLQNFTGHIAKRTDRVKFRSNYEMTIDRATFETSYRNTLYIYTLIIVICKNIYKNPKGHLTICKKFIPWPKAYYTPGFMGKGGQHIPFWAYLYTFLVRKVNI